MIERSLVLKQVTLGKRITIKSIVSVALIAFAVILPQLVHLALGQPGGVKWLPMYLPVLLAGCLVGPVFAAAVGIFSPVVSYLITSMNGKPMPVVDRLPYMMVELFVFAFVASLFSKKIYENGLWAFPAVILAQISGRAVFLGMVAIFGKAAPFKVNIIWEQIKTGVPGLLIQAVVVPILIIIIRHFMVKEEE